MSNVTPSIARSHRILYRRSVPFLNQLSVQMAEQFTTGLPFLNISGYKFVDLEADSLPPLRTVLLELCQNADLCGSVQLSTEGINLMLCGRDAGVQDFVDH